MKVLLSVNHPAQVHLFKYVIRELKDKNHEILLVVRDKDVTVELLKNYGFEYILISGAKSSLYHLVKEQFQRLLGFLRIIRSFKPDLCVSAMDPCLAFASKFMGIPYICCLDTEHATFSISSALPFTDAALAPACFEKNIGPKQIRYKGYHELAYLHPNNFTPDPGVLDEIGISNAIPIIVLRFVSWDASHDIGQYGIKDKFGLVKALEPYGCVLISSEGPLPKELERYRIRLAPEKIHDLLNFSSLYMGEGATMAAEAAILGIPSIYVSSLVGTMGNFNELQMTYDLLYGFVDSDRALKKAIEILQDPASKEKWRIKRERLLKDKIDVTAFLVRFIENYPQSFEEMKKNPEWQHSTCTH